VNRIKSAEIFFSFIKQSGHACNPFNFPQKLFYLDVVVIETILVKVNTTGVTDPTCFAGVDQPPRDTEFTISLRGKVTTTVNIYRWFV